MKAITISRFGGPEVLEVTELPVPEPGPAQVRVRVRASSVNPIDLSTRSGALAEAGLLAAQPRIGFGWDVAGEVEAVGASVTRWGVGDAVIGLRDLLFVCPGAHAEQVVLDQHALAPAPAALSAVEAATLPLNALTAEQALRMCDLRPGQSLLVTGAAGGVGGFTVELAAMHSIRTLATASPDDEPLVRRLGATDFIPRDVDLPVEARRLAPGGVDAVIDTARLGITAHNALRGGGTFITLVRPFAPPPIRETRVVVAEARANGAHLTELSALAHAGWLTPRVASTFALDDAVRAHHRLEDGGTRGRVVLVP